MVADDGQSRPAHPSQTWQYRVPKESSLTWFVAASLVFFAGALLLSNLIPRTELPPMIEVDLGFEGVENEPPPLGEPDAGGGDVQPEPPREPEKPEMQQPEPPAPEPIPEEPVVEQPPAPEPTPSFVVPEEVTPPPPPKPVAAKSIRPSKPAPLRPQASAPAGSGIAGAKTGVRGSPVGQPGGRGGSRGDFISTPHPQYDATSRQRGYQGRGVFLISYQNGRIVSVTTQQSTGVSYLDARTIAWVKSRFRVKSGVSGEVRFPITWQLK
jgi:outer membrane biosynthesis protein TonB